MIMMLQAAGSAEGGGGTMLEGSRGERRNTMGNNGESEYAAVLAAGIDKSMDNNSKRGWEESEDKYIQLEISMFS
jgi:hypothetical protein